MSTSRLFHQLDSAMSHFFGPHHPVCAKVESACPTADVLVPTADEADPWDRGVLLRHDRPGPRRRP